jgi:hypothetical protein
MHAVGNSAPGLQRRGFHDKGTDKSFFRASILVCAAFAFGLLLTMTAAEQKIYWSANEDVQRANLDRSAIEDVVVGSTAARALDFDEVEGKVYWIDSVTLKIQRFANTLA